MKELILGMILAGSALMVYNIIRYGIFIRKNRELERQNTKGWLTLIPHLLLIFFLVGYVVVGLSGIADLMMASILLGGSIFVFMLLWVMYAIVAHVRDTEQILATRYEEIKQEIDALMKNALAVFRVNLTRDEIEERRGDYLYESDLASDKYSEILESRHAYVIDPAGDGTKENLFKRENLIRLYQEGLTRTEEMILVRRSDGVVSYVKMEAILTKKPVSGDVVAFIVETPCNEDVVRRTLMERVLMDEYDRVAYVINGNYKVLISNSGKQQKLLLRDEADSYESVYLNYMLPAMAYDPAKNGGKPNPLRLSVIEKELADKDFYEVDAPFEIEGEQHYKHFSFYMIDRKANFFLMLLSDSTKFREEQEKQNRELTEALAAAVRSNESRVRFFTNISHTLRTPLNGILGFYELADKESDPEVLRQYISKIGASGQILLARINDLFDMSRIDSGAMTLNPEPADLASLAESAAARAAEANRNKNLTVSADTAGVPEKNVQCDPARLTQILDRLIEGAATFAPEDGAITLSVTQDSKEDASVCLFRIRSKGVIPQDVQDHFFESDAWDNIRETDGLSGIGIGMAVVKALIDLMGGETAVRTEGDETVVEVRLPLPVIREKAETCEDERGFGPLRLLVVDDNEINREIAQLLLTGEGHEVTLAENGADAVEKVKASGGAFDAVLMDVQMPVMNGFEATGAIRALPDPKLSGIPIIAMTANVYQGDKNEATEAGMDGYVPKPINVDEIHAVLKKVLSR